MCLYRVAPCIITKAPNEKNGDKSGFLGWHLATQQARKELGLKGFVHAEKDAPGDPGKFYKRAREIFDLRSL